MTEHLMEAGSASQTTSDRLAPIINIATSQSIGYVSSEYLHTRARTGLVLLHGNKAWKILHITDDDTILVLPCKNLGDVIQRRDTGAIIGANKKKLRKASSNSLLGLPTPSDELVILESFQNYLIIHTLLGLAMNTTLRLVFDALLTEQDVVRDSYSDAIRILVRTPARLTRDEVKSIESDLFHITHQEFDRLLNEAIEARSPSIVLIENRTPENSQVEKTLRRNLKAKLAIERSKSFLRRTTQGRMKTLIHFSTFRPTPLAKEIIDEYTTTSAQESDALIKRNAADLKRSIEKETCHLLCLNCLSSQATVRISQVDERPKCEKCGSSLLGLPVIPVQTIQSLFRKKKSKKLSYSETKQLAGIRRTADLLLAYGKKAIIALSVTGIGPQTASSILTSMPLNDSEFYSDLLKARIHYLTTRELWDKRKSREISSANHARFNI